MTLQFQFKQCFLLIVLRCAQTVANHALQPFSINAHKLPTGRLHARGEIRFFGTPSRPFRGGEGGGGHGQAPWGHEGNQFRMDGGRSCSGGNTHMVGIFGPCSLPNDSLTEVRTIIGMWLTPHSCLFSCCLGAPIWGQ